LAASERVRRQRRENLNDCNNEVRPAKPTGQEKIDRRINLIKDTMNKSRETNRPILKYIRELSIVVTGIVITIGTGILVNNNNNKKDQKQYLETIKFELEENAKMFDYTTKWLQKPLKYARYLNLNDKKSLNKDTLNYYGNTDDDGCGYTYVVSMSAMFKTNAFEMLKFSGTMRQIKNKELLLSIWEAYSIIEMASLNLDMYFRRKEEEVVKNRQLLAEGKTVDAPMYDFHTSGIPFEMVRWSRQTSEIIKETLSKFEDTKIVK